MKIRNKPAIKIQQGFSLIELMIAIPLSLLVLFAVLQIFTGTIQGVNMQNGFSRVQENGRMAIEMISRDIRGADNWGCANDISAISNKLSDPDDLDLDLDNDGGISGEDEFFEETDALTLRGAHSYSDVAVKETMASNSSAIKLTTESSIVSGDIILISDCESGDIFTNTSASKDELSYSGTLSKAYAVGTQVLLPFSMTYFIAESVSGDGVYSLYRSDNGGKGIEMVHGIKDLQVTYGVDSNDSGSVDTYYDADDSDLDMNNVVVIRVVLVSESGSGVSGTALERTFSVTTTIRNRTI